MRLARLLPLLPFVVLAAFGAPAAPSPAFQAAVEHYTARRDVEAEAAFNALVKANPSDDASLHYLSRLAKRKKDWAKTAELLEQCTKIAPKNPLYWVDLGEAYGQAANKASVFSAPGLAKKSRAALEKAIEVAPEDPRYRVALIEFHIKAPGIVGGSLAKAREQAEEIKKRDAFMGWMALGRIEESDKEWTKAELAYREADRLKPASIDAQFAIGQLHITRERYSEAFDLFEGLVKKNPQNYAALYQIGRIAALSGERLERGESALNTYLLAPKGPGLPSIADARLRLGEIFVKRNDPASARVQFEEALKLNPGLKAASEALAKLK